MNFSNYTLKYIMVYFYKEVRKEKLSTLRLCFINKDNLFLKIRSTSNVIFY